MAQNKNGNILEKSAMIKEYFDIYTEKRKEFGEKTCVLYENGAFYEIYQIDNEYEKIGNASILSKLLNDMKYASKIIGKMEIHFIGFNTSCLDKFLPLLLSADYTVVIVNQLEDNLNKTTKGNLKRGVSKIYSPSLQPLDYTSGNLLHLLINIDNIKTSTKKNATLIHRLNTSICCVKNEYNMIELSENIFKCEFYDNHSLNLSLEEIDRIVYRYFPKELEINIHLPKEDSTFWGYSIISNFFKNNYEHVMIKIISSDDMKKYNNITYQNTFLKDVYSHINFGLIQPIEYMNLQNYNLSIINLILTLEFIGRHDISYIKNLNLPEIIVENNNLVLELNTLSQLNIVNKSLITKKSNPESVFDVINFTQTAIGKRHLHSILCKPFKNVESIQKRYYITEELSKISDNIDIYLKDITDFEKLHRKMALQLLHPYEFNKLHLNYKLIISIIKEINKQCDKHIINLSEKDLLLFHDYISDYSHTFNLNKMEHIDLNTNKDEITNYFNEKIVPELDVIQNTINEIELKRKELQLFYHNQIASSTKQNNNNELVKLMYTENEGYSFSCTKIRFELLLKKVKELEKCKVRHNNNVTKFYPEKLLTLCSELIHYRDLLHKKVKTYYLNMMKEYYNKYNTLFKRLKEFIEVIDVCNSNFKCKIKYNYVQPEICETQSAAMLEAYELRHPIIERLGTHYIPNDITLNHDSSGILLYGLNSSGKSSILRAIGISVILAQCGLYVPCKKFIFYPFHTIISQVDLTDNLFSGKSSYINETLGLKRILKCADQNTLILCDEMCKGTEYNSSISLVTSTLLFLLNKSSKLFFTSHLHEIARQEEIIQSSLLKICHMHVSIKNDKDIIFERIIRDGVGSELYGLEVAKNLLNEPTLIDMAFHIRNRLVNSIVIKKDKKSRYNTKKIIKKCEICNSTNNLETDHIMPQCNTNESGFINNNYYHKNELFNLAILCKSCHLKKTQGKIIINGYKDSINGRFLDFIKH